MFIASSYILVKMLEHLPNILRGLFKLAAMLILFSLITTSCNDASEAEHTHDGLTLDTVPRIVSIRSSNAVSDIPNRLQKPSSQAIYFSHKDSTYSKASTALHRSDQRVASAVAYLLAAYNHRTLGEVTRVVDVLNDTIATFKSNRDRLSAASVLNEVATIPLIELATLIENDKVKLLKQRPSQIHFDIPVQHLPSQTFGVVYYDAQLNSVRLTLSPANFAQGRAEVSLVLDQYHFPKTTAMVLDITFRKS